MFFYKFFSKSSYAARRFAFGSFCVIAAVKKAARWMMLSAEKLFFKMAAALCRAGFLPVSDFCCMDPPNFKC